MKLGVVSITDLTVIASQHATMGLIGCKSLIYNINITFHEPDGIPPLLSVVEL